MQSKKYGCPVEITIDAIGGKWKPLILWHLRGGFKRYSELEKLIPGVTQKMLTQQLKELEGAGLVDRHVYAQVPPKVEYSLTALGETLKPLLEKMCEWGRNYTSTDENPVELSAH